MSVPSPENTWIDRLFTPEAVALEVQVVSMLQRTCTRYDASIVGLSVNVGISDQSCTRRLFLKKRNCAPPPMQPPGFVVLAAETTTFSPSTTMLSSTAWARFRLRLKPLSPCVASQALVGQTPLAGVLTSARGGACACRAPVMTMSSTYHPSSPCVPIQEPTSSYDESVLSNSQDIAIQRIRTRWPRKLARLNFVCTHRLPEEGAWFPGVPFWHWNVVVWSRGLPQL